MAPRIRRLTLTGLATLGVLVGGLALPSTPAIASLAFPLKEQLNGENTPEKSFGIVASVAVDDKTGDVLVGARHAGENDVQVLDSSGNYLTTWTGKNTPSESFADGGELVAANNSTGEVYVLDESDRVVDVFHEPGNVFEEPESYLCQITGSETPSSSECDGTAGVVPPDAVFSNLEGLAVDQATGDVYVAGTTNSGSVVDVFNASGEYQSQITEASLPHGSSFGVAGVELAVDGKTGDLLVTATQEAVVYVFDSSGAYLATWNGGNTPAGSFTVRGRQETLSVAADDTTGDVFVFDAHHRVVDTFNSAGEYVAQITGTPSGPFSGVQSVAVDQATGDEYVASEGDVDVFGPGVVIPSATPGVPSSVRASSATLNGTVNPEGFDAHSVLFEYVGESAYRHAVEEEEAIKTKGNPYSSGLKVSGSPEDAGSGIAPVPVSASVTGLLPGSEYHYRVTAANTNGTDESADQRLITAPALGDRPASGVSQFAATLNATVEPGEVPTSYHFVYGTTAGYGSMAPVPDTELPIVRGEDAVSQAVTGLQAGATYHFAVVASSSAGTFTGPDQTFTTPGIPAPLVSTGAPSGVTQGQVTLSGAIDPQGWDTTYRFEYGTSTAYGSSQPTVDIDEGALMGSQPVSILLQNLSPGTTYHYRLVATSGGGTAYGADGTFTTAEYPPSIVQTAPVLGTFKLPSTAPPKPLTNAQKLAKALKVCKKQPKRQRASCEKSARKKYRPVKKQKNSTFAV